jgi:pSer/pThr/pTyr-binding forkhead associated (FHA) protein
MTGWILTTGGEEPLLLRLPAGAVKTVGRTARADFIVDAALVSRLHCKLIVTATGDLVVEDLGSTNGTLVNGRRVEREHLKEGDTLSVGRMDFTVRSGT